MRYVDGRAALIARVSAAAAVLTSAALLSSATPARAASSAPVGGPRKRIAVMPVEVKLGGVVSGTPVTVVVRPDPHPSAYPTDPRAQQQPPPPGTQYPGYPGYPNSAPYPTDPYGQQYPSSSPAQYPSSPAQYPSSPAQYPSSPAQYPSSPAQDPSNPYPSAGGEYPSAGSQLPQDPSGSPSPAAPGASSPWASAPPAAQGAVASSAHSVEQAASEGTSGVAGAVRSGLGGALKRGAGSAATRILGWGGSSTQPAPEQLAQDGVQPEQAMTAAKPDDVPAPAAFGAGLTDMLATALVKTEHFVVLERSDLASMRAEQALGQDALANPETAARAGKLLGAQALVRAVVTEYGASTSAVGGNTALVRGVDVKRTSNAARVVIDVRIFDAETGQIVASESAEGSSSSSGLGIQVVRDEMTVGRSSFAQTPLGRAARDAIDKAVRFIVERLDRVPWRGRIAEIDSGSDGAATAVYVNAGSRVGLRRGDVLEAYDLGREIVDPDSGTVIGRTGTIVGRCRVEDVNADMSVAVPVSGANFRRGALVRFLDRAGAPGR